jgi:hypothetical protein
MALSLRTLQTQGAVMNDSVQLNATEQEILNYIVSDEALEAAADVSAMSYTHQTSAYNRCCR